MTWQFWIAFAAFVLSALVGIRREIINRRFVREYLAILWSREMSAIEAVRKQPIDADDARRYGTQRHLFGIAQGYREARHEAERSLRRDW